MAASNAKASSKVIKVEPVDDQLVRTVIETKQKKKSQNYGSNNAVLRGKSKISRRLNRSYRFGPPDGVTSFAESRKALVQQTMDDL